MTLPEAYGFGALLGVAIVGIQALVAKMDFAMLRRWRAWRAPSRRRLQERAIQRECERREREIERMKNHF